MSYPKEDEYQETKAQMRVIGAILVIAGIGAVIFGLASIFNVITAVPDTSSMQNFQNFGSTMMGNAFIGGISLFIGFILISIGYKMYIATHIRGIAKYAATELSPTTTITTEALASGLARGIEKEGGLNLGGSKEVIRVKCRNCGYLETEDATFCSKCGKPL
ncbi:MAG: hypothetical protein ACTSW1_16410 [Candidatus Hodarchaeales archaeon]